MPGTRKLGRTTAQRKAMLRGMVTLLLENGQVETTLTRAKEVRSIAEKMITLGKKNTLASRRAALAYITKEDVVTKVFVELAPLYAERNGGYTQIYKLGPRRGDGAEMAIVKLVDYVKYTDKKAAKKAEKAAKAEAKKAAKAEEKAAE
jgi:large subunit ribosomal protein L17